MTLSYRAILAAVGAVIAVTALLGPFASVAEAEPCTTPTPTPIPTSLSTGNESGVTLVIPEKNATRKPNACGSTSTPLGSTGGSGGSSSGSGKTGTTTKGTIVDVPAGAPSGTPAPARTSTASDGSVKGAPLLRLDRDSIAPNQWMLATGDGYTPGEEVHFVLFPRAQDVGTFTADASGRITARFRIPADTRPGAHTVEATGVTSHFVRNTPLTVVSAVFAGDLPYRWWISIVVGAILLGLLVLVLYFRRSIAGWFAPSAQATGLVP